MNKKEFFIPSLVTKTALILLSILGCLILIELSLRLAGYIVIAQQDYKNRISIQQKGAFRILCLGESTTALGGENSYPTQLEKILNSSELDLSFSVINKGLPSVNSSQILAQFEKILTAYQPNMVIVMLGINDAPGKISEITQPLNNKSFIQSLKLYKFYKLINLNLKEKYSKKKRIINSYNNQLELAWQARENQDFTQARTAFYKELKTNPKNSEAFIGLIYTYLDEDNFPDAEKILENGLAVCPEKSSLYAVGGFLYKKRNDLLKAEIYFKKSLTLNPNQDQIYLALGSIYHKQNKLNLAEENFRKAIEINPQDIESRSALGWCLFQQNKIKEAEEIFKRISSDMPSYDQGSRGLKTIYQEQNKINPDSQYSANIDTTNNFRYNLVTIANLKNMFAILNKRKIKFVCMQYPLRNLKSLRSIFDNDSRIIFVDNELSFKEALKKGSYKDYFIDMFAGDFGHCSPLGNRLIAQNAAKAILKEYFKK